MCVCVHVCVYVNISDRLDSAAFLICSKKTPIFKIIFEKKQRCGVETGNEVKVIISMAALLICMLYIWTLKGTHKKNCCVKIL